MKENGYVLSLKAKWRFFMKLFKNCEECRKLIQEDYQDITIIGNLCIMSETLTSIVNMMDEIGQYRNIKRGVY